MVWPWRKCPGKCTFNFCIIWAGLYVCYQYILDVSCITSIRCVFLSEQHWFSEGSLRTKSGLPTSFMWPCHLWNTKKYRGKSQKAVFIGLSSIYFWTSFGPSWNIVENPCSLLYCITKFFMIQTFISNPFVVITLTLLRGSWGRCEKNYLRKEEGREGGEKSAHSSNPGPVACYIVGEGPQLHARGAV